jgi:hypothetical protein
MRQSGWTDFPRTALEFDELAGQHSAQSGGRGRVLTGIVRPRGCTGSVRVRGGKRCHAVQNTNANSLTLLSRLTWCRPVWRAQVPSIPTRFRHSC